MSHKIVEHQCLYCGTLFKARARNKFCSRGCASKHNSQGSRNPNWKEGISANHYHYKQLQKERYPERVAARDLVNKALKSGRLVKQPCHCGSLDVQAHHHNYNTPLDVTWLCKKHHDELTPNAHLKASIIKRVLSPFCHRSNDSSKSPEKTILPAVSSPVGHPKHEDPKTSRNPK